VLTCYPSGGILTGRVRQCSCLLYLLFSSIPVEAYVSARGIPPVDPMGTNSYMKKCMNPLAYSIDFNRVWIDFIIKVNTRCYPAVVGGNDDNDLFCPIDQSQQGTSRGFTINVNPNSIEVDRVCQ